MHPASLSRRIGLIGALLAVISPEVAIAQPAAQTTPPPLLNQPANPSLRGFRWRSIGPVGQGGRVDDIAVDEKRTSTWYVGFAVGGIAKTVNNGTTFEPIFDTYGSASIADITLAPSDANIIYVATGEANNRQTTTYGDGLYKSTDAGKTFRNVGFKDAQTLGRVVVHPRDPNTVWVAVGGDLYGSNTERGVFMSTDGGSTWRKTLYVDEFTSATDIIIDPSNPQNLWAAMYQRQRTAWGFNGGGPGSGMYSSTDGGRTWKRMSGNGLPRHHGSGCARHLPHPAQRHLRTN
jgi:Sortilin, neurotensin receptor 3,